MNDDRPELDRIASALERIADALEQRRDLAVAANAVVDAMHERYRAGRISDEQPELYEDEFAQ